MSTNITMREMLEAGVHFGHKTRYWNPKMEPYIFGSRSKIHIINLERTLSLFNNALSFIDALIQRKGKILFVGTKRAAQKIIKESAEKVEMPYVNHRWLGGMLTNYKTVRRSVRRLKDLEKFCLSAEYDNLVKKEQLSIRRKLMKLERSLGGIKKSEGLPDALFVVDVKQENIAVVEAQKLGIPVIAIVDTNCSPEGIDYIIPGNDDAIRSIDYYLDKIISTILEARIDKSMDDEYIETKDSIVGKPSETVKKESEIAKEGSKVEIKPEEVTDSSEKLN